MLAPEGLFNVIVALGKFHSLPPLCLLIPSLIFNCLLAFLSLSNPKYLTLLWILTSVLSLSWHLLHSTQSHSVKEISKSIFWHCKDYPMTQEKMYFQANVLLWNIHYINISVKIILVFCPKRYCNHTNDFIGQRNCWCKAFTFVFTYDFEIKFNNVQTVILFVQTV